jgi:hypothetical protein
MIPPITPVLNGWTIPLSSKIWDLLSYPLEFIYSYINKILCYHCFMVGKINCADVVPPPFLTTSMSDIFSWRKVAEMGQKGK